MKTILRYIIAGTTLFSITSCEKFLDREPISQVTPENFFTSEQNAQSAVMGMYRSMLSPYYYGQTMIIIPEFSANHVNHAASYPEFVEYKENRIRVDNPWTGNLWNAAYATINAANNIISRVAEMPQGSISEEKKSQFIQEAKFVRGLTYFNLVRAFGSVPLVLTPTAEDEDLQVAQSAADKVYEQIIADLKETLNLPDSYANAADTKGRATGTAGKALLTKVYLYHAKTTGDYTEAARLAGEVVGQSGLSLPGAFGSVWAEENTSESIFELQFDEQAINTLASVSNPTASMLFYAAGEEIAGMYEASDKRKDFTVYPGEGENSGRYYIGKYRNYSPAVQNFPVIRLAEILLIHAEAKARADGNVSSAAWNSFKTVRDRAGITTPQVSAFASVAAFVTEVQEEKRREMMFEGEAWFDYCRTGLALTEMMKNSNPDYFLYPIPDAQRLVNPLLQQNKGY